ncbi:MAG: hypothetical protein M3167_14985 [Acidobacteriota bacterium]|nr:hypothetical protein [Acidobacteriota bacterium]
MRLRRARLFLALSLPAFLAAAAPAGAQSFNLRDLLTDFVRNGILLAPPTEGPPHTADFVEADNRQLLALEQFNTQIANQLSSFPLASSGGGFTYRFDPQLGVLTRTTGSFGTIYTERADTIGKGRFNLGLNFSHSAFTRIDNLNLRNGDLNLVFTHADDNGDGGHIHSFFEGDVITAELLMKIETDITAFVLNYGVSDRLDIGVAVPIVRVKLETQSTATIQHLSTFDFPLIHRFPGGGNSQTLRQSGSASGVGDVALRGKLQMVRGGSGGLAFVADVRLPTGDEQDLLGTGTTRAKGSLIGSLHLGIFSSHLNAGYTWSTKTGEARVPNEISYAVGLDLAVNPRMTLAAEVLGRDFRKTSRVRVVNTVYTANTNSNENPPTIREATFPTLTIENVQDLNTLIGSVGLKFNPVGNLLLTVNGLFSLNREGLQSRFTPLVGIEYSF